MPETKELALNGLGCVRFLLVEASRRRLSPLELKSLAFTMLELSRCIGQDEFAACQLALLNRDIRQEFLCQWPGSQSRRTDALLTAHVLAGHLLSL